MSGVLGGLGLIVGIIGLIAQVNAPHCPVCGAKLIIVTNYCVNCRVSWNREELI